MHTAKLPRFLQPFRCDDLIRLGKDHDGGYLVNKQDIHKTQKLVSFGIGTDCSFEEDFTKLNDCAVSAWDSGARISGDFFQHEQRTLVYKNISRDIDEIVSDENIFLKCDIDGDEYGILDSLIKYSRYFVGIVMEFHDVNKPENFNLLNNFISKMDQKLVHLHVNNYFYYKTAEGNIPDILELSFSSSPNVSYNPLLSLPHHLDMTNNPDDLEFKLVF